MQEIAERAGVGRTTVSLSLRNHPKISEPTRLQIQKLAKEMGYRPNPLVAAHMAHIRALHPKSTSQCLAFLCNRSMAEIQTDAKTPVWKYFQGARDRAAELGFRLELFNLNAPEMTERRLSQILLARGIDGVIIGPLTEGGGLVDKEFDWRSVASVMGGPASRRAATVYRGSIRHDKEQEDRDAPSVAKPRPSLEAAT